MNYDCILQHVRRHISLTEAEEDLFMSSITAKKIKKKQVILLPGQVCNTSMFVVQGCLKSYSVDDNGFDHILQFAPENWWITDMYSFISGKPAHLYIDAIEDTEVFMLRKEDQEQLYDLVPKFERYFRILIENSLVSSRSRVLDNLELTARQRYAKFCAVYPTLVNTLQQKLIAAYVGVKPEFFSKMKSEFFKEK